MRQCARTWRRAILCLAAPVSLAFSEPDIAPGPNGTDHSGSGWSWESRGSWEHRERSGAGTGLDQATLSLRRMRAAGSVAGEFIVERRGAWGAAAAIDIYQDLWTGAYGNARVLGALDTVYIERADLFFELFQAVGRRWELSGSARLADYRAERVPFLGVGLGAYLPRWYLRSQLLLALPEAGATATWANAARRYFTDEDYVEGRLDVGGIVDPKRYGTQGGTGVAVSVSSRFFPFAHAGAALGAGWEGRGDAWEAFARASLLGRW